MSNNNRTAVVSPAALREIKRLRAEGFQVTFHVGRGQDPDYRGRIPVASVYPARHESITVYADGETEAHFTGEDADVDAAIERRNDAWASAEQEIEDRARGR